MDPLSEIIALLRPNAAISKPITARGCWSVRYRAHEAPGFTLILAGQAWVTFEGSAPLRLAQGDFLLMPATPAFSLGSERAWSAPCWNPAVMRFAMANHRGSLISWLLAAAFPSSGPTLRFCSRCCPDRSSFPPRKV
jgi:hypothetical protein